MEAFIEETLLWTKADGSPGILEDGATTPEHLAKLEEAVKALEEAVKASVMIARILTTTRSCVRIERI